MHEIEISREKRNLGYPEAPQLIRRAVRAALRAQGITQPCAVSVLLTDDAGIRAINRAQRGFDAVTDVLSFPLNELTEGAFEAGRCEYDYERQVLLLGDIVLNLARCALQGEEYGHGFARELSYLSVHSVLHLLGYDHTDEGERKRRMRGREKAIMALLFPEHEERDMEQTEITKTAMVTLCGRPNVGKSTLTNTLAGEKLAIVSPKPQTTRNRITAVVNRGETQLVLMDTPGFHRPRTRLGTYMVNVVEDSIPDVELVLLLVEPIPNVGEQEAALIARIQAEKVPAILVINKIDTVEKETLLAVMAAYCAAHSFDAIIPISALRQDGTEELLREMEKYAVPGPALFPAGVDTDQPDRQVCAELVREKLLRCLDKEVPHGTAVEVTRFSERDNGIIDLDVTIYCEKASHKGIIIGKQGAMLKKIGESARRDIERFMGTKVFLQTWVKVRENWRDSDAMLRNFGYGVDK